jgi:hypothetical protein
MFFPNYGFSFFAGILIIVGIVALLTNLGVLATAVWKWWPVLLIVFGIYVLVLKGKKKKIVAGHILHKITADDRIQDKVKKIIETVDAVIDKKLDEWHGEATGKKKSRRK